MKGFLKFMAGGLCGAAAGLAAGVLLAPRSGAESRAMAADAVNDAWDTAVDSYERNSTGVKEKIGTVRPNVDSTTDELRAKVDLARERMDQLRDSLSDAVANKSEQVQDVVDTVSDTVASSVPVEETEAEGVRVEVVEGGADDKD